jgi:signal peptidase II
LGVGLDLWSKHWAFHTLRQGGRDEIIPYVLEFQTMLNDGALFGIGSGRTGLFLVASVLALVLVFWMFAQTSARRWTLHIALGAILAGALGNMYDRAFVILAKNPVATASGPIYMFVTARTEAGIELTEYPPHADALKRIVAREPERAGFVRDFIKIPTRWFGGRDLWPWVFNVADVLLVGGVAILALHLWRDRKTHGAPPATAVDSPTATQ